MIFSSQKKKSFLRNFRFTNVLIELGWKDIIKKRKKKKENFDSHIDALNKQTIDQLKLVYWISDSHSVRTYVSHLLGTYVIILCNWLILWQNTLYSYLGRSRMCIILQEIVFQNQVLKICKSIEDSSWRSAVH